MDFGALPPEVNSGRMYTGAGPGPLLAAATAWAGLSAELANMAAGYESAATELGAAWHGPSAAAMAAAAAPFTAWLNSTAARADQAAAHSKAAAAAYEAAFAATVPPPVIAANRSLLSTLVATNVLGQNAPAIAATEALYAEMWAQDATAMYTYAAAATSTTQLTPFTEPPQTTNLTGAASQSAATAQSSLAQLSDLIAELTGPYSPLGHIGIAGGWWLCSGQLLGLAQNPGGVASLLSAPKPITGALAPLSGHLLSTSAPGRAGLSVSAALSRAGSIAGLSVPPAWAAAAPAVKPVAAAAPGAGLSGIGSGIDGMASAAALAMTNPAGLFGGTAALAGLAGRAMDGAAARSAAAPRAIGTAASCVGAVPVGHADNTVTILVIPAPEQ